MTTTSRIAVGLCAAWALGAAGPVAWGTDAGSPSAAYDAFMPANRIDELVLVKLRRTGIPPSAKCVDEVFVRRVFLDVLGTLPSADRVRRFLADTRPDKRSRLIDEVLARDEFADYWGLKWGDLLRVKSEFPCNLWPNAVQAYDRWIRDAVRRNMPYDQFARELLTASGSNFRVPPVNFYRGFQDRSAMPIAENVALVFMGVRLHDAGLPPDQVLGLSAFFAKIGYKATDEWKEEIVFFNPDGVMTNPATGRTVLPAFPGEKPLALASDRDPRAVFADWLTSPRNPWFARAVANRVWFWLLGRGLVHEPDDMKPANAPWSPELLAWLEQQFVGHGYDVRYLFRLILNSSTYQLDSRPNRWNAADVAGFSHYRMRRLDAEPLLDAINQITGGTEKYVSAIPEPFTFLPADQRAITLADGSVESAFLELFGRPPRNTSFESERVSTPSVFQAQHLLNSSDVERKIERSWQLAQVAKGSAGTLIAIGKPANSNLVDDLYLRILSRFPAPEERRAASAYLESPKRKPGESACDLVWALMNTKEFILKH